MLEAHKIVESLLAKMKAQCVAGNFPSYELFSDELATFAKAALIPSEPVDWHLYKLSRKERCITEALHRRINHLVTKDTMMNILYFDRPDPPGEKILDVFVHKIRGKIVGSGFAVETDYGQGWTMRRVKS
jgi:DNA-binding response OmpR family regulator